MKRYMLILILLAISILVIADSTDAESINPFKLAKPEKAAFKLKKINEFRQGMSVRETQRILDIAPEFIINSDSLKIESSLELRVYNVKPELYYSQYFVIYEKEKLVFWGFPSEINKSENNLYRQFSTFALNKVEAKKERIAEEKQAEEDRKKIDWEQREKKRKENGYY